SAPTMTVCVVETPPPGDGFLTLIWSAVGPERLELGRYASNFVDPRYVVTSGELPRDALEFGRKLQPDNCTSVEPLPTWTTFGVTLESVGEGLDTRGSYNSAVWVGPIASTLLVWSKTAKGLERASFIKSTNDQVPVATSNISVLS